MKSWLSIPSDSDFSLHNIPFGVGERKGLGVRVVSRLGDHIIDLYEISKSGLFAQTGLDPECLKQNFLNAFMAQGKPVTRKVRERIQELFTEGNDEIRQNEEIRSRAIVSPSEVKMLLPVKVGDYTDFYSSKYHAFNVGSMFRPDQPLLPNWLSLPVAYHGRSSSIVCSDTPVKRPSGQYRPAYSDEILFGPTNALDFELEMAFIIGKETSLGESVPVEKAEDHIFGMVLFNDWSARDIQSWEYQPLGPFLSKNFMSSVSPWVVTLEALEPFRVEGPEPEAELFPYLRSKGRKNFDIELEVFLEKEGLSPQRIVRSNFKYMYWNICQQLAHHTVNGCNIQVGDMMASGTISGPDKESRGCLLELTWRGKEPVQLADQSTRTFLENGDTVTMKGFAKKDSLKVGFGEVRGKITG